MARKRMVSPSMWVSQSFSELSIFERLVFVSLFSHADDEGRGIADPAFIKSMTFPFDGDKIRVADVEKALLDIGSKMSVQFYSVNGKEYYFMTNWFEYQKIDKPTKSKLPPPPNVGEGGDIPNRGEFGESSASTRGIVAEGSPPNRSKYNISTTYVVAGLTDADYADLCNRIGKDTTDYYVERVEAFREKYPQATFAVKAIILKWWREDTAGGAKGGVSNRVGSDFSADELNAAFDKLNEEL